MTMMEMMQQMQKKMAAMEANMAALQMENQNLKATIEKVAPDVAVEVKKVAPVAPPKKPAPKMPSPKARSPAKGSYRVSGAGKTKHGKTIDGVYERLTINTDEYRLAVKELYACSLGQCESVYGEPRSPFSFGYDDEIKNNKMEILKNIYRNKDSGLFLIRNPVAMHTMSTQWPACHEGNVYYPCFGTGSWAIVEKVYVPALATSAGACGKVHGINQEQKHKGGSWYGRGYTWCALRKRYSSNTPPVSKGQYDDGKDLNKQLWTCGPGDENIKTILVTRV